MRLLSFVVTVCSFLTTYLYAQTFESYIQLGELAIPYSLIELPQGFLVSVTSADVNNAEERQSILVVLSHMGEVVQKIEFPKYYIQNITNLYQIDDASIGALGYVQEYADSAIKIVNYQLINNYIPNLISEYQTDIHLFSSVSTDVCMNQKNNLVYQLVFHIHPLLPGEYYYLEFNRDETVSSTNQYSTAPGLHACITPYKDSSYLTFEWAWCHELNSRFEIIDTTYINEEFMTTDELISGDFPDVIWENDSILIASMFLTQSDWNTGSEEAYYMGLCQLKWGKELIEEKRFPFSKYTERAAYHNTFDRTGDYYYLATSTNNYGSSPFIKDTTGIRILKLNKDFSLNWEKRVKKETYCQLSIVKATSDGGCIIVGRSYDFSKPDERLDLYVLKLDSAGNFTNTAIVEPNSKRNLISIYPNPGNLELNITLADNVHVASFSLYSLSGIKVFSAELFSVSTKIQTSQLQSGIYVYELNQGGGVLGRGKWVKN